MPAKAERVTQGYADRALLGFIKGEIQAGINFGIIREVVDRRWNHLILNGHDAGRCFDSPGSTQQMPCHGFSGADVHFKGVLTEVPLDGLNLLWVAERRGGTVRVNVVNLFGPDTRILYSIFHDVVRANAIGVRSRDVVGIGRHTRADNFSVDFGPACHSVFILFQN